MRGLFLVARRELGSYLNGYWGFLIVSVLLFGQGLIFNAFALGSTPRVSSDVLEDFFYLSFGFTVAAAVPPERPPAFSRSSAVWARVT